jgi:hypothetical protein
VEAKQISVKGNAKLEDFSNEVMWNSVVDRLFGSPKSAYESALKMNLNKIPVFHRIEARFFNFLASNASFEILFIVWFRGKEKFRLFRYYLKRAIGKAKSIIFG